MNLAIGRISEGLFSAADIRAMHELRYEVFHRRLQWDVVCEDGREFDRFDALDPIYMLVKDDAACVCACWRLLPTTGPTMLKDTFPQTLWGQPCPQDPAVWELSRFAMGQHPGSTSRFSEPAVLMMEGMMAFALARNISSFVTVVTVGIERLLRSLGLQLQRFGAPVQIGREKTVGLTIAVNRPALQLLSERRRQAQLRAGEAA